jgi:hypothetical protein
MLVVKDETETETGTSLAPLGRLTEELLEIGGVVDKEVVATAGALELVLLAVVEAVVERVVDSTAMFGMVELVPLMDCEEGTDRVVVSAATFETLEPELLTDSEEEAECVVLSEATFGTLNPAPLTDGAEETETESVVGSASLLETDMEDTPREGADVAETELKIEDGVAGKESVDEGRWTNVAISSLVVKLLSGISA